MHISLGLLWLCFQIIHGEIIRCPMGGLDQEDLPQTLIDGGLDQKDLCQTLIDDSVFNKFYNRSFQRKMKPNSKYMYDVYDNPYYNFEENTKEKAITWTPAVKHYLMLGTTLNSSYRDTLKMEYELSNNYVIFRQSIIVDDDDQIDTQWNDVLSIGTDTYRLKYHNILSNKYYKIETNISSKEFMVVVQSYYNAASTHYFSRDYKTAQILIEEGSNIVIQQQPTTTKQEIQDFFTPAEHIYDYNGLSFIDTKKSKLKDGDGISSHNLEVWKLLLSTLKEDIKNIMNNEMTEAVNYLSILDNIISLLNENNIPSSTALFFRIYFLDPDKHATIESKLKSLSPKNKIWESIENDNMYNKNISMHYYLMFSIFGKEVKDRVVNIIKAIQRPVLCVEDRLLNYEANKLALEMFQDCLDENTEWTSSHNIVCKELNDLKKTNRVLIKTIIPKLTTEHYAERHKQNPIKELYISLSTPDMMINEKILHVIVTAAIDYIDTNSNKYKKIKENIKLAIKFLKHYAEGQEQKLNDEEKTYILDEENIPEQDVINYDTKEHMDVVYNTYYSNKDIRIKNIFIAFKWLAELNGVLSNNSETDILQYQIELKSSIDKATKFVKGYDCIFYNEDHLNYLRVKRKAKILAPISRWEASNWAGGWISSKRNKITLKMLNCTTLNDKQIEMYDRLRILKYNLDCPYINKIELNILLYRYVNMMYPAEYDTMYSYIKDAIDEVVISSEDRVRNMEAHELFSKYLMQRNRNAIEKGIKLTSSELYKKFLKPPIDEEHQRNGPNQKDEDNL